MKAPVVMVLLIILGQLAVYGFALYALAHFLMKFW